LNGGGISADFYSLPTFILIIPVLQLFLLEICLILSSLYRALRKIASILLICLLLFNWYGYRFVTNYLQKKADSQLEARLDVNDYDESQLIEIRIELNIPYQYS